MSNIDWSKAPEWATSYAKLKSKDWFYYLNDKCYAFYTNLDEVYEYGLADESTEYYVFGDFNVLEERPSKPIFTQSMVDNGILPSVGMEYLCEDGQLNRCLTVYGDVCIGLAIEHIKTNNYLPLSQTTIGNCRPLTPPIELIEGKAYQFDYKQGVKVINNMSGICISSGDIFLTIDGSFCIPNCTNIKLLEVKL